MSKYYNNLENEQLYHAQKVADALEFIEARMDGYLVHSDEYTSIDEAWDSALMHYGVLGMRWRRHLFDSAIQALDNETDRGFKNPKKLSLTTRLLTKLADRVAEKDCRKQKRLMSGTKKLADKIGGNVGKKLNDHVENVRNKHQTRFTSNNGGWLNSTYEYNTPIDEGIGSRRNYEHLTGKLDGSNKSDEPYRNLRPPQSNGPERSSSQNKYGDKSYDLSYYGYRKYYK